MRDVVALRLPERDVSAGSPNSTKKKSASKKSSSPQRTFYSAVMKTIRRRRKDDPEPKKSARRRRRRAETRRRRRRVLAGESRDVVDGGAPSHPPVTNRPQVADAPDAPVAHAPDVLLAEPQRGL
mmetsp:Transcript_11828/g.35519  ORF Transcript_11828/g.35519 Transcript_11828/m.35519 type:complete len:125 (-) Transcript_11828:260-634(-)